jgi:RND family efflux transporter MFP subunit
MSELKTPESEKVTEGSADERRSISNRTKADLNGKQITTEPTESFSPPKRSLLWAIILLLVGVGTGWGANWLLGSRPQQTPPTAGAGAMGGQPQALPVKLATVERTAVENSSEVVAALEARRTVTIAPEIAGRVTQILVNEGDRIRQGQLIARLDSDDLEAELAQAKASLANARAQLAELEAGSRVEDIAEARAALEQAQARLDNARSGSAPEEIAQAQAQVESAQAEATLAGQRVKRYRQLAQEGAISEDEYQEYVTENRSAEAALQEAKRRLSQLRAGRQSDLEELSAAVAQQQQNVRRLENGARSEEIAQARAQVAEANARVQTAQANLQETNIFSPWAGTVGDIPVKVGTYLAEGDELTTLTENDVLEVNLSIPIEERSQLRLGLPVEILNVDGKVIARGKTSFISPNVAADSQLVLAKAALDNYNGELLNNQLIRARVIWSKNQGILVPTTAITRLGGEAFVFVAQESEATQGNKPQLIASQKLVELGSMQGNNYQVLEGLEPGDRIVTAGSLNLSDGTPIASVPEQQETGNRPQTTEEQDEG